VKYGVGIFTQFGEFTLRYRLMQQVYVEAVQSLATSVDLLYKMEFD
jgi:translocation and assembly module TamB